MIYVSETLGGGGALAESFRYNGRGQKNSDHTETQTAMNVRTLHDTTIRKKMASQCVNRLCHVYCDGGWPRKVIDVWPFCHSLVTLNCLGIPQCSDY